jgi:hypothetical protein
MATKITDQFYAGSPYMQLGERRAVPRKTVALDAQILWREAYQPLACKVLDLSDQGARLETLRSVHLPASFELIIPSKNVIIAARMIWRDETHVGVRFCASPSRFKPNG